jgi:hypothetical protein
MKVTNLEDARAMQRMSYPLDTPVEHRMFSKEYTRHWVKLMEAHIKFMRTMSKYSQSLTPAMWNKMGRRFDELITLVQTSPPFEDDTEQALHEMWKQRYAFPFLEYWAGVFDAAEDGAVLKISSDDIPMWVED